MRTRTGSRMLGVVRLRSRLLPSRSTPVRVWLSVLVASGAAARTPGPAAVAAGLRNAARVDTAAFTARWRALIAGELS